MEVRDILKTMRQGLLCWYEFEAESNALILEGRLGQGAERNLFGEVSQQEALRELLEQRGLQVSMGTSELLEASMKYDYIIMLNELERAEDPAALLRQAKNCLSVNGHLLIGAQNRLGLKYFCGERDPFTNRSFDGIENYRAVTPAGAEYVDGRLYSRAEMDDFLSQAGMQVVKRYSVLPDLEEAQLIYAQDYLPEEELGIRYFPKYRYPDSVFLEEQYLYTQFIKNGMFHEVANTYLIDWCANGRYQNVRHVTLSTDRGEEDALATVITTEDTVEKCAIYPAAERKLEQMMEYALDLEQHGVPVVNARMKNGRYVMPYIEAEVATEYFEALAAKDKDAFIQQMDHFRDLILQSSEQIEDTSEEHRGILLKRAYIDLVPLNCFYRDGEFLFYDQEFYYEDYPANVIVYRMLGIVYANKNQMEQYVPMEFFMQRYGLKEREQYLVREAGKFVVELRNQKQLASYNEAYHVNARTLFSNRQRVNDSEIGYEKMFVNLFENLGDKKLILFGSGTFAQRFVTQFGSQHQITAIADNNRSRVGQQIGGIPIISSAELAKMNPDEVRVIICVKMYMGITLQLEKLGITDYKIYDVTYEYKREVVLPDKSSSNPVAGSEASVKKPYHVGYIAGVFDLFHVGHLNMFKRAKEQCDYLIVGVVSDEGVKVNKETTPFVPFSERIEMVRSCRYVDEAVEIPYGSAGTKDAYQMYHFDCQFSGSDYEHDPYWLAEKEYLEKHGSTMIFFPYTQSTSSTKLKKAINDRITK